MSVRDDILERIRRNLPSPAALPEVPTFEVPGVPLVERFRAGATRMGGRVFDAPEGPLEAWIRELFPAARSFCSATPEVPGRTPDPRRPPAELADVDVGVVRARFGVAETGSVWITEAQFRVSALGFLSQHLVVLLDPASLVANMHVAYRRRPEFDAGYGVFMTGPSATADIEGVLIHGAQGIRSLTVVLKAAPRP